MKPIIKEKGMEENMQIKKIEAIFNKTVASSDIYESCVYIENTSGDFSWSKGHGGRDIDSPMILTSVSKLFTTTCILVLKEQGLLSLNDKLIKYFDSETLDGLHIYKNIDYSKDLTVANLLFQTSGFPDIYEVGKNNLHKQAVENDFYISFDEYVKITKQQNKLFAPSTPNKSHYSDMNFEMLGEIIEKVANMTLHDAFKKFVFKPLKLEKTYMPENKTDFLPNIYYKNKVLYRPKLIASLKACGGCISTSREIMIFIKAFFGGKLFDKSVFKDLSTFNYVQYAPLISQYGGGFMKLKLDGIATLFMGKGELLGHIGMTGAFAFYYPQKDLFFVGDVNQFARPALTIKLPIKLAMAMK